MKRHAHRLDLVRSSLRVVVLRWPAGAENPIPSSCFSKSVSKYVAESSELFSKVSRLSFSFSAETKMIICELKFEFAVIELWSVDLEPSVTLVSHAADFNKKIPKLFLKWFYTLNFFVLRSHNTCVASREFTLNPIFTTSYLPCYSVDNRFDS